MYTGLQAGVKLVVNYTLGKMAAVLLGPAGLGLLGQFQSLTLLFQNCSNGAIQSGVIKYLAAAGDEAEKSRLLRTAFSISLVMGLLCGLVVFLLSPLFNHVFHLASYRILFAVTGASCVFFSLNVLLTSVFNAFKDYRRLAFFNIVQSLCNLVLFLPMTRFIGLPGALASVVLFQVLAFGLGWLLFRRRYREVFRLLTWGWDKATVKKLAEYSLMTLAGVATLSLSQLAVRGYLIRTHSDTAAGLWEGLNRISNFYIFFLALIITSQVLPRYAEATSRRSLLQQLRFNCSMLIPMTAVIIGLVFLLRDFIIRFVFTAEFLSLKDMMVWHLLGDFLKITAWIFSNVLVARKYTRVFLLTDLVCQACFVLLTLLYAGGVKEVTIAYACSNGLYLLLLVPLTFRLLKKEFS